MDKMKSYNKYEVIYKWIVSCKTLSQLDTCLKFVFDWHITRGNSDAVLIADLYNKIELKFKSITIKTVLEQWEK